MEQPDRTPQEATRDAIDAAMQEVQEDYPDVGVVMIMTMPPNHNSVRYGSNIPNEGVVPLLQTTAQNIAGRMNSGGNNGQSDDSNIVSP